MRKGTEGGTEGVRRGRTWWCARLGLRGGGRPVVVGRAPDLCRSVHAAITCLVHCFSLPSLKRT